MVSLSAIHREKGKRPAFPPPPGPPQTYHSVSRDSRALITSVANRTTSLAPIPILVSAAQARAVVANAAQMAKFAAMASAGQSAGAAMASAVQARVVMASAAQTAKRAINSCGVACGVASFVPGPLAITPLF